MPKCDRELCSQKIFRGKNTCGGYFFQGGILGKTFYFCPCNCHQKETKEDTIKKIKQDFPDIETPEIIY